MKTIFRVLLLILAVLLLTQCGWFGEDEPEPIENVDIPDQAFLNALIDEGVDTNGDSLISFEEAEAVISLDISGHLGGSWTVSRGIRNMKGIEAFINLDTLDCSINEIRSLDLTQNTALRKLVCYINELTSLDVSGNTRLEYLGIYYTPDLYEVCVWTLPFPPPGVTVSMNNSPNVFFTTECSN